MSTKQHARNLLLITSNATKEYTLDALETLASPFSTVQHFRYSLKWLDDDLRNALPLKSVERNRAIAGTEVVVCYLYQQIPAGTMGPAKWIALYPLRKGKLVEAYKTGSRDQDIAHFYFQVKNFFLYDDSTRQDLTLNGIFKNLLGGNFEIRYASFISSLDSKYIAAERDSLSAFIGVCDSFDLDHFNSQSGEKLVPFFCHIEGVRDHWGKTVIPKYDKISRQSIHKLIEGNAYALEFSTYFCKKPPQVNVTLECDSKIFTTPSKSELRISSRYDEESWSLVPALLEKECRTNLKFQSTFEAQLNPKPLELAINLAVRIKRNMAFRILELVADFGFAAGTAGIALWKDHEWAIIPVYSGYFTWIGLRFLTKLWRA